MVLVHHVDYGSYFFEVSFNTSGGDFEVEKLYGCYSRGIFSWIQIHIGPSQNKKYFMDVDDMVY